MFSRCAPTARIHLHISFADTVVGLLQIKSGLLGIYMHVHTKNQTFYQLGNRFCNMSKQINNKLLLRIVLCNIFINLFSDFHLFQSPGIHTMFIFLTIFNEDMASMITKSTRDLLMAHAAKAQQREDVHGPPPSCGWPPAWLPHILKY